MFHVAPRGEKKDVKEIPVPLGGEGTKRLSAPALGESTQRGRGPLLRARRPGYRREALTTVAGNPATARPPAQLTQLPEGLQNAEASLSGTEPPKDLRAADEETPSVMMQPNNKSHHEDGEKQHDLGSS